MSFEMPFAAAVDLLSADSPWREVDGTQPRTCLLLYWGCLRGKGGVPLIGMRSLAGDMSICTRSSSEAGRPTTTSLVHYIIKSLAPWLLLLEDRGLCTG